jgi:uncharacterized membrane protein YidH (DUF202 family)
MRPLVVLGVVLVVVGIVGLVVANVSFTEHKTVLDAGPIKITEDQQRVIPIPTIASIAVMVVGLALVFAGRRR